MKSEATSMKSDIASINADINTLNTRIYPVGSIYMSVNNTNPSTLFGGTWERIKDRFLLAAGNTYAVGSTGGEAQHTLTVDEMPAHSHITGIQSYAGGYVSGNLSAVVTFDANGRPTANTGGNQPHNNMPPYLAVYMWKRTA